MEEQLYHKVFPAFTSQFFIPPGWHDDSKLEDRYPSIVDDGHFVKIFQEEFLFPGNQEKQLFYSAEIIDENRRSVV